MSLAANPEKGGGYIRNFYAGKHIFLTGCTGFYGSVLLEKLLRTCTEIGSIYVMTREKKGLSIQERMEKYFKKNVFDTLRAKNPNFMDKVIPIHGDLHKPDLNLSAEDRKRLVNNVNIIIHNASMVYFEAKPSFLLRTNVLGTLKMLELAAECPNLDVFLYVSTAYSNHYTNPIEEKFYPPPCGLKMIEDMIRADEENANGLTKEAIEDIVGKYVNLYAFSKAVTEGVVEDFARRTSLPCIVYRPSIMVNALQEPYRGWLDTKNGPVLMYLVATLGLVHAVPGRMDLLSDYIHVDLAANSCLAAIWDYVVNRETNGPQVYNYGSSDWNPLHPYAFKDNFFRIVENIPSRKVVWYPFVYIVPNFYLFLILHVLFHVFPAIIADAVLMIQRKKPKALKLVYKITKQIRVLRYFITTSWVIKTDKLKSALTRLNPTDLEEFPFDQNLVDWNDALQAGLECLRETVLNETPETIPYAKKRFQRLKMLHYTVVTVFCTLGVFILYRIMTNLFS